MFHIVIPARFGSTRLPGKALLPIADKPMVAWVWERAMQAGGCLLYTSPSPRDATLSRMPSSA